MLFALAICMGLTQFSFGALVRTRWAYALRGSQYESLLNTAYALEAAIDEIVFIFGPILAAFLATSVHPVSQLFVPTLACGIGGAVFFSLKNTSRPCWSRLTSSPPKYRTRSRTPSPVNRLPHSRRPETMPRRHPPPKTTVSGCVVCAGPIPPSRAMY